MMLYCWYNKQKREFLNPMVDDEYRNIFVKKLKYYMELNNVNQMDLMKEFGLSSSTVSNWCTGKKLPRMGKIQMLADYFGINKSDLLEEKTINNPIDQALYNKINSLSEDKKKLALAMIDLLEKDNQ